MVSNETTRTTAMDTLVRERMAAVGVDVDESVRKLGVDDAMMAELTNAPAEPLDLDGLTVESMLAAQQVAHEVYKAKVDRDIFGPPPVFLAPGPSGDAVFAMRYALDMTRPRLDTLIGYDPGAGPDLSTVLRWSTDGTWHMVPRRAGKTRRRSA